MSGRIIFIDGDAFIAGDPYWHDVELLLHADEGSGNALTDQSSRARSLTAFGNAALGASTDWAASEMVMDGTGDYWTVGGSADDFRFLHDGSMWTFEYRGWRNTAEAGGVTFIDTMNSATGNVGVYIGLDSSRRLRVLVGRGVGGAPVIDYTSTATWPNDNDEHDLCIEWFFQPTVESNNLAWYVDGTRQAQANRASPLRSTAEQTRALFIGRAGTATTVDWNGGCSFMRITSNVLRYNAASYTPPTFPVYKNVSSDYGDYVFVRRYLFSPASGSSQYTSEPQLVVANDGTVVCAYRRGASHVDNTGYVACKRSSTKARSWGSEIVIADDATYDTRNPTIGKDPSSGRLVCFYRTMNATGNVHQATYFRTSPDHGATWSSSTDISSELSAAIAPYGTIVETSNGLMQLFYEADVCEALFSTDGGQTWGSRVTVYTGADADAYNEPYVVAIDTSRLVIIARVDQSSGSEKTFAYCKSSDGGSTWGALTQADFPTAATINTAAPAAVAKNAAGDVVTIMIFRSGSSEPPGAQMYSAFMDAEDFWTDPADAIDGTVATTARDAMYQQYGTGGADGDWGYPNLCQIPGGQLLCAWYDLPSGSSSRTSLLLRSMP